MGGSGGGGGGEGGGGGGGRGGFGGGGGSGGLGGLKHPFSGPQSTHSDWLHVYSLHHLAQERIRSAALLFGSGHSGLPHEWQSLSAQVASVHHEAQPGFEAGAALAVSHFGLLHAVQSATPQWASVHHLAQPGVPAVHFGLAHRSQPSASHVSSLHHEAQPAMTGAAEAVFSQFM